MTTDSIFSLPQAAEPGGRRALALALLVHFLFFLLLTVGLHWHRQQPTVAEAELWTAPLPDLPSNQQADSAALQDVVPTLARSTVVDTKDIPLQEAPHDIDRFSQNGTTNGDTARNVAVNGENGGKTALPSQDASKLSDSPEKEIAPAEHASTGDASAGIDQRPWDQRVKLRIAANTVYEVSSSEREGKAFAEFAVKLRPNGSIADIQLIESSGSPEFDEAVRLGIVKSQPFPRDPQGKVPADFNSRILPVDVDFVHRFPDRAKVN